jgi:ATP-dependent RNA helicase DHX37/DHR1
MGRKKARFYKDLPRVKVPLDTNAPVLERTNEVAPTSVLAQKPTLMSASCGRKQKLLEKYIAKKLKKEARPELMARLGQLAFSNEALQSTKQLLVPSKRANKRGEGDKRNHQEEDYASEDRSDEDMGTIPQKKRFVASVVPSENIDIHAAIESIKRSSLNPLDSSSESEHFEENSDQAGLPSKSEIFAESITKLGDVVQDTVPLLPSWETYYVLVNRTEEIMEQRSKLPVFGEEQRIMEVIRMHPVVVICGETGSGKTTQVPQFLYEAGYGDPASPNPGLIGVTQPRRVAAISMAQRVSTELNSNVHVSYQIRYDGTVNKDTRIKFMTDGILLRELTEDFLLNKYSVIVLDEAHERNLNTDILIGMLSRVVKMRNQLACQPQSSTRPLGLIIMSATLNVEEFVNGRLFQPAPPVLQVEARQHPVTMHFAKKTEVDHVDAAYRMVCKIHANLPPGGILVFLTGKQEIVKLARRLDAKYAKRTINNCKWNEDFGGDEFDELVNSGSEDESNPESEDEFVNSDLDDDPDKSEFAMRAETREPLLVLPLYSLLAPEEQQKVFQTPPEGTRLCVLATNVAETSLTIPNIRYVVDSGLVKQRHFDPTTGAQEYRVEWTSKASATQRAGRAGRVGPGHCYRLYSSAVFEHQLPAFSVPEIQRTPIEGLVLQLKTMGIDKPERFPLPTTPEEDAIMAAQKALQRMGALKGGRITMLGRLMAKLPLAPIWSRLLVVAAEMGQCSMLAVALASVMSVGDPFLDSQSTGEGVEEGPSSKHSLKKTQIELAGKPPSSDLLMWLNVLLQYESLSKAERRQFCNQYHLMPKRVEEMSMQFKLVCRVIKPLYPDIPFNLKMRRNDNDALRKLISESLSDRVAERIKNPSSRPGFKRLPFPAYRLVGRSIDDPDAIVYLHPTSVLSDVPPQYIVYTELVHNDDIRYIKYVTAVEPGWLPDNNV